MKLKLIALSAALIGSASATTITAGGGTGGAQFYTSQGSILTNATTTFRAGTWNGSVFTAFGTADPTPIVISTVVPTLAGRWSAGFTDNNTVTASPFNGQVIWFEVTTTLDGGGTAYFSGTPVFPNTNNGVGDSLTYNSTSLLTLGTGSTAGSRAYQAGDGRIIIGVVPEPSVALLGALGALGLIRRRR